MKKICTLFVALMATLTTVYAQGPQGKMTFVGESDFYVTMAGQKAGQTTHVADTIIYAGADFTMPSMVYNDMVIPSFEIKNTTYTGGYGGVTWEDQTFTSTVVDANGDEKTITGSSLKGSFSHDGGMYNVQLEITFKYGNMPFPITYSINSYYVKSYTGENVVMVGGTFGPYKADVTHKVRVYNVPDATLMDVEIPTYTLTGTVMGDLTIGTYTVTGLYYDEEKGGYYKDYSSDGLKMHFKAETDGVATMDAIYDLSTTGGENIFVELNDGKIKITNNFQPGVMPFPISAVMDQNATSAIERISENPNHNENIYNLQGQKVDGCYKGIVIKGGKKFLNQR